MPAEHYRSWIGVQIPAESPTTRSARRQKAARKRSSGFFWASGSERCLQVKTSRDGRKGHSVPSAFGCSAAVARAKGYEP
ncbi:MAG: hypothetical protein AMJ77_05250 [Dehalococcoidia bacterium SM23_28_2]|nr:MAG: hypothetical protein AMJ77_05250 [Dehalococcoidia bacterium SM23_28_2]